MNADKTVVVITLNRPDAKNALNAPVTEGIELGIKRIKASPSVRVYSTARVPLRGTPCTQVGPMAFPPDLKKHGDRICDQNTLE